MSGALTGLCLYMIFEVSDICTSWVILILSWSVFQVAWTLRKCSNVMGSRSSFVQAYQETHNITKSLRNELIISFPKFNTSVSGQGLEINKVWIYRDHSIKSGQLPIEALFLVLFNLFLTGFFWRLTFLLRFILERVGQT